MRRRVLSLVGLAIVAPLALVATGIPSASAQPSMTITVGKPTVTARILVTVPVTIVCASLPDPNTAEDDVSVSIEQASGRTTVSTGSGSVDGGPFSPSGGQPFLTCDGSQARFGILHALLPRDWKRERAVRSRIGQDEEGLAAESMGGWLRGHRGTRACGASAGDRCGHRLKHAR
jgi:hypothetical protein